MGDAGTMSVAASNNLTTTGAQAVTGAKTFNNQTLILRNPADTQSLTFTNPVITSSYPAKFYDSFRYLVYKDPDDSNYKAKRDNWSLESSNTDALTVLNYAITNSENKGPIGLKGDGGTGSAFVLTGKLNLIDKNVSLIGLNQMASSNNSATTSFGGGPVFKKNYATAEPFIDMTNTVFCKTELKNISIIGNGTSGDIGVKAHDLRERMPAFDNVMITGFDTGMEVSKALFTDIRGLSIFSCATTGLQLKSTLAKSNTFNFYGGRILSNPTNLLIDASSVVDCRFFGTRLEGMASGHVKSVNIAGGNYGVGFYGCSFEKNGETNPEIILDNGNNNTYFNCRFDCNVNYTPFHTATGRNHNIIGNFFQVNTAAVVATILIDAGAVDINLLYNTKSTSTVGTVTLTDSGTRTTAFGNQDMGIADKIPGGITFNNFNEDKIITAPSDPATGFTRRYAKTIDANNDGLFAKRKINGAVVEVQL